jgi:hypothetical protein
MEEKQREVRIDDLPEAVEELGEEQAEAVAGGALRGGVTEKPDFETWAKRTPTTPAADPQGDDIEYD